MSLAPRTARSPTLPSRRPIRTGAVISIGVVISVISVIIVTVSACTIGPSVRPELATYGDRAPSRAADSTAPSTIPLGPGGPGRTADPVRWTACPAEIPDMAPDGQQLIIDCGAVLAPISYPQPQRGSLTLQLARARSATVAEDAPPLVVLGEPGRSGRNRIAAIAASLPESVRDHYAIIVMDPRGTGDSSGIDCVTDSTARAIIGMAADPSSPAGGEQLTAITRQLTFDCGDTVGPALTQINSTNAADDLDTVRAALGQRSLSLVATGGGATIGAAYVNRYPGRAGTVVLDSPADPLTGPDRHAALTAAAAQRVFDDFAASCARFSGGCPLGADPARFVSDLVARLATSGEPAGDWVMTGGSVLLALLEVLPDRSRWPTLAQAIAQLDGGAAAPLADLLTTALGGDRLTAALSARILFTCNDSATRLSPDRITELTADGGLFGRFTVALAALCAAWPAPDAALAGLSGAGAAPVLVIGSAVSPRYPFAEVQSAVAQLASAVLVTWQSEISPAYPVSSCVTAVVNSYLLDRTVPDRGVLCPP